MEEGKRFAKEEGGEKRGEEMEGKQLQVEMQMKVKMVKESRGENNGR